MTYSSPYTYVAIDVSKAKLRVQTPLRAFDLPYTAKAIAGLITDLHQCQNPLVVYEATGGYESRLMLALAKESIAQNRINTRQIKGFAASEGIRAKTDPIDARLILKFAQDKALCPMIVPSEEHRQVAELMDRRAHLSEQMAREKNRCQMASASIEPLIKQMITHVEKQITEVDQRIHDIIVANPKLQHFSRLIQSVKGVGEVTAWTLLAYLPELLNPSVSRNRLVALAGLAPFNRDIGKKSGKRYIQAGRAKVRRCLYMAARSAATHNPVIRPYVNHLVQDRGKPYRSALVAAMRKILIHIQSIIKNDDFELV